MTSATFVPEPVAVAFVLTATIAAIAAMVLTRPRVRAAFVGSALALHEGPIVRRAAWLLLFNAIEWAIVGLVLEGGLLLAAAAASEPWAGTFAWAASLLPGIGLVGLVLFLTALAMEFASASTSYLAGEALRKPRRPIAPQLANAVGASLRSIILLVGAASALLVALSLWGGGFDLSARISAWASAHAGELALVVVLAILGWFGGRLIQVLAGELAASGGRLGPEVTNAIGTGLRWTLYGILGLIALFTLLSAVGLGSVGGTVVVILSSFIGLVVAMAATGSIGNGLAGAVILAFRPFRAGDRIALEAGAGDILVGDVIDITLMFTRLRLVSGESTEVPNNLVLSKRIRNLSTSREHAVVVRIGIGYHVSHARVRELAIEAARTTEGVLVAPPPHVWAAETGNFAIQYDVYAYTTESHDLPIRSALIGRLQEVFYGAGVEIMTPDVRLMRFDAADAQAVRVAVDAPASPLVPGPRAGRAKREPPEAR
jgi:small conductance mechanosensitive channel